MAAVEKPYLAITEEALEKIKNDFLEKNKDKIEKNTYHQLDIERLKKDNKWIRAFYKHSLDSADKCLEILDEVLTWRKNFGANDLLNRNKLPFNDSFLPLGALFKRNKDKQGRNILNFAVKTHKKNRNPEAEVQRFIAFFLEREYTFSLDNPIVLLFDMSGAGLANTDLDMTKFVVNSLKTYYPGLVEYVVVFDMPMIFQAIWKIIKALLPAQAVELVKFVDKKTIGEFIDENNAFVHMGGKDTYQYKNEPSVFAIDGL